MKKFNVVCMYCQTIVEDNGADEITHGCCDDCFFRVKQIIRFRDRYPVYNDLSDELIWKFYKNSMAMAFIRIDITVENLIKSMKYLGHSAQDWADAINKGFKKLREKQHAKNPRSS